LIEEDAVRFRAAFSFARVDFMLRRLPKRRVESAGWSGLSVAQV